MKQMPTQQFVSECGKARVFVENDMPIGVFHDFLMMLQGTMVDRMKEAHKEMVAQSEAIKKLSDQENLSQGGE